MEHADVIIVGGGAGGMTVAANVKRYNPRMRVLVFEAGNYISFGLCGIPYYIEGKVRRLEDLVILTPEQARQKKGIEAFVRAVVEKIDPVRRTVDVHFLDDDRRAEFGYKYLVLATGAKPVIPPIPGTDARGVFTLRTLDDAENIRRYIHENGVKQCVVVGAGFIGLEMAEAFATLGCEVKVVEMLPTVVGIDHPDMLGAIFDEGARHGVQFLMEQKVESIGAENGTVRSVFVSGKEYPAQLVLLATGIKPNTDLAQSIGLELGAGGAIYSDLQGATSRPGIYAVGDCTQIRDMITGRWTWVPLGTNANKQGRVTGMAIAGKIPKFKGIVYSAMTKFFDLGIEIIGLPRKVADQMGWKYSDVALKSSSASHYYVDSKPLWVRMWADAETGRILGGEYVGPAAETKRFDIMSAIVSARMTVEDVAYLDIPYVPSLGTVWDPINIAARKLGKDL